MKSNGAVSKQAGLRNILIAGVVIVIVGVATFFGTSYLASIQLVTSQPGSSSITQVSEQNTTSSSSLVSTSGQSSVRSSVQSSVQTSTSLVSCSTAPTIAVDGSAINFLGSGSSASVSLSTSKSPDVVIVFATVTSNPVSSGTTPPTVTSISGSGGSLIFHKRTSTVTNVVNGANDLVSEEEWYAIANLALSNDAITVNVAIANSTITVIAFGVSGANTTSPFDPNPSVPGGTTGTSIGAIQRTISTSDGYDLVVGGAAMASYAPGAGAGYTLIQSDHGGGSQDDPAAESQAVCSPESNYGVSFTQQAATGVGTYYASTETWIIIGDAIVQATITPPFSPLS